MTEVTREAFKQVMGSFASGVTVVTTVDEHGHLWGLTVSAFSSLSLDPPLCLVCVDKRAGSHGALVTSRKLAINILADSQEELSIHFASRSDDKLASVPHRAGPATGCPLLVGALATIEGELVDVLSAGDHDIFVAAVLVTTVHPGRPLVYFRGGYADLSPRAG